MYRMDDYPLVMDFVYKRICIIRLIYCEITKKDLHFVLRYSIIVHIEKIRVLVKGTERLGG